MCDTNNLIDLTGWDEPVKNEITVKDTHLESLITESNSFTGPYDPFDSVAKEACIKGLNLKNEVPKTEIAADIQYADQELNNETPPVAMEFVPTKNDKTGLNSNSICNKLQQRSLQNQFATKLCSISTPPHPHSAKFSRNSIWSENLQMIAAESPVKLIEDEPNPLPMPIPDPVPALSDETCSNTEFEARLKMLRIAILDSSAKTESSKPEMLPTEPNPLKTNNVTSAPVEVGKLLQDLKALICEHVDISKRNLFDTLLESLNAAVQSRSIAEVASQTAGLKNSPHTYTRQATFDLDLEIQKNKVNPAEHMLGSNRKVQEFPDAMTCSSVTFDGETRATSPIIETEFAKVSPDISQPKQDSYVTGLVNENLALQINEILERHNLTKLQINDNDQQLHDSEHNETKTGGGQTVIFVVNATSANQLPSWVVQPSTIRANKPDADNVKSSTLRRRSSSLSIHDKSKQSHPRSLVKQYSGESNNTNSNSSQYVPLKELSNGSGKLNTMASLRHRRNSFSVGLTAGKISATAAAAQDRTLLGGRSKTPAISESSINTKAGIPIKRVVPMIKPSLLSAEATTPHCNGQDTPMPAKGKTGGKMFCTSTPMPQLRSMQRRSLRPVNNNANSSVATPSVRAMSFYKKTPP